MTKERTQKKKRIWNLHLPVGDQGADSSDDEVDDDVSEVDDDVSLAAPDEDIDEGATPGNAARYNLRPRVPATNAAPQRFNVAMDEPHNAQTYYPPTQLLQVDRHNLRAVV